MWLVTTSQYDQDSPLQFTTTYLDIALVNTDRIYNDIN